MTQAIRQAAAEIAKETLMAVREAEETPKAEEWHKQY